MTDAPPKPALPTASGKQLLAVLGSGAVGMAAIFLVYTVLLRARLLEAVAPARLDLAAGLLAYAMFLAAGWAFVVRPSGEGWRSVGLRGCDPSLLWIGGFLALLWIGISSVLYAAAGMWEIALAQGATLIAPFRDDAVALIGLFLLGGPVAALVEEVLFRGMLYAWLRKRLGTAVAAIVSALIFTAMHLYVFVAGIAAALDMFLLAVLLALLFELGRSLWPSILCHALNNTVLLALYLYSA